MAELTSRGYGRNFARRTGIAVIVSACMWWMGGGGDPLAQDGAQVARTSPPSQTMLPPGSAVAAGPSPAPAPEPPAQAAGSGPYSYDPSGRRDPFKPVVLEGQQPGVERLDLPPLQRVGLTELNLIGIIWGGFGYSAMVQTPDGKGYTVKRGTRIGPNNGVVSAITENAIIVQEQFADVYGKKQVREYVKHLHTKEGSE